MKLEEIEKLCEEATPGPWEIERFSSCGDEIPGPGESDYGLVTHKVISKSSCVIPVDADFNFYGRVVGGSEIFDAKFIASSRTLMPKLLAVAKAVQYHAEKNGIVDPHDMLKKALEELERE